MALLKRFGDLSVRRGQVTTQEELPHLLNGRRRGSIALADEYRRQAHLCESQTGGVRRKGNRGTFSAMPNCEASK